MFSVASSSVVSTLDRKRLVKFETQIKCFKGNEKEKPVHVSYNPDDWQQRHPPVSRIEWELQDNVHQAT